MAAVWVGLALQPCAMAEVAESDCPHCPTKIEHVATPESHCDTVARVVPDIPADCDSIKAECCHLEEGIVNARADTTDTDDEPVGAVSNLPSSLHDPGPCADPGYEIVPPEPSGGSVRLHVLKCVYLN